MPVSNVPARTWTTLKEGGGGVEGSEAPGQQLAATPPLSGKICTAVLRLERHSRCTTPYPAVYHNIRKKEKEWKRIG